MDFGNESVPVALKPFNLVEGRLEAERECMNDYFGNAVAYKMSIGGLQPVGIIDDASNNFYTVTVLQRSLDTFDNIDWADFSKDPKNNPGMLELWTKAAHSIAILHSIGDSYHGDLFPRNIATNPEGQVFPIDWEYGEIFCNFSYDLEARFGARLVDLKKLTRGMANPINIGDESGLGMFMESNQDWWELFRHVFYDEYRSWRIDLASQGKHHMKILESAKSELGQLDIDLRQEMSRSQSRYGS